MSLGSALVGIALTLVLIAYVARPFRRKGVYLDEAVEAWVIQAREDTKELMSPGATAELTSFCPQCGWRVESNRRFCPGCGAQLQVERAT